MNAYLSQLLASQELRAEELSALRPLRDKIEDQLSSLEGSPRFYYGGSFGKRTMIREAYDLDIVVYWPNDTKYKIAGIYLGVGDQLKKHWRTVKSKTVAWELPFQGGFHIDVVPGRALDSAYQEANLYRTDTGTTLKTNLKLHINTVRDSGRRDVIRLMKLWRARNKLPFKKSFLLELLTIYGCKGVSSTDLELQMTKAFEYIESSIESCNIRDPANTNNSLSDDLDADKRRYIRTKARAAIRAQTWNEVFEAV